MPKVRKVFVCTSCGGAQPKWSGKCPDCGAWDTLEQETLDASAKIDPQRGLVAAWSEIESRALEASAGKIDVASAGESEEGPGPADVPPRGPEFRGARSIAEMGADAEATATRLSTGIAEFDRVLGASSREGDAGAGSHGLVPGSAVLVGGEPGIGKSTLLLQAAAGLARMGTRVLYVSSEESAPQVRSRAVRLGATNEANLFVLADTNLARIVEQARRVVPAVMVIDSIQMVYRADLPASPGSPAQLRRCCAELVYLAKASGIAVVMVGHVTKDGRLAGPRLIEHLVDAVLAFEGDRHHAHRIVRALKNRYGTTLEIGLFEMGERGLSEVGENAALGTLGMFGGEGGAQGRTGSVVCPVMTGTRCVMVELQALTATGFLGAVKRKASGIDANRLAMLIAVLEQHAELRLADRDVFASSVGGIRVTEPASDLALLLAIAGAHFKRSIEPRTCALGEVGLGGEVRGVAHLEARLREAARLGFTRAIVPKSQAAGKNAVRIAGLALDGVSTINEAIERLC
ncbi:MAG: DNA repair protein RadA [Phycisphaerales bacterium]|jgi:DNA repair protein RadA/Sms|nr:DNA repair protein RadA [Phycisphaerales bacterium]